jgi:hypothetical protein
LWIDAKTKRAALQKALGEILLLASRTNSPTPARRERERTHTYFGQV